MAAGKYDILCEQGATLALTFTWKDENGTAIDLTGYSAAMKVRPHASSDSVIFTAGTSNLTVGTTSGTIALSVSSTATAALAAGTYAYDLELTSGSSVVTRLLEGKFTVKAEVTR